MIVFQLWRYPVASIGGHEKGRLGVVEVGVPGDRESFLVDLKTGEIAVPEKAARWRPALQLASVSQDGSVYVKASGWTLALDDERLDDGFSEDFDFRCDMRRRGGSVAADNGAIEVCSRYVVSPLHIVFERRWTLFRGCFPLRPSTRAGLFVPIISF